MGQRGMCFGIQEQERQEIISKNMSLTLPCRQGKRMFYEEKWNELRHGSMREDVKHWGSVDSNDGWRMKRWKMVW